MPTRAVAPEGRSMLDLLPQGMLRDVAEFMGVGGPPDPSDLMSPLGMASGPTKRTLGELARRLKDSPVFNMNKFERRLPNAEQLNEALELIRHPDTLSKTTEEYVRGGFPTDEAAGESFERLSELDELLGSTKMAMQSDDPRLLYDIMNDDIPGAMFEEGDVFDGDDLFNYLDELINSMQHLK